MSLIGQILACPKCGSMVLVEAPADENTPAMAVLPNAEQPTEPTQESTPDPSTPSPAEFTQSTAQGWMKLAFTGVGAVACLSTIGWYAWSRNSPPESAIPSVSQSIVESKTVQRPVYESPESEEAPISASVEPEDVAPINLEKEEENIDVELVAEEVDPFYEADRAPSLERSDTEQLVKTPPVETTPDPTNALASLANLLGGSPVDAPATVDNRRQNELPEIPIRTSISNADQKRRVKENTEQTIRAVRFKDVPLIDFLRAMSGLSGVPISLDPDALEQTGSFATAPVSVSKMNTSSMEILRSALAPIGMQPIIEDLVIRITTPRLEDTAFTTPTFYVGDLLEGDGSELDLANFVATLVEPSTWKTGGGQGTIELIDDQLKLSNTQLVVIRTAILLEKIRVARSLPPRKKIPSHLTSLEPRWTALSRSLAQPVDVDIWDESRVIDVVSSLEKASGIRILVDWQSLSERGITPNTTAKLYVRDTPLETAIEMLAGEQDLAIIPVDKRTIQITTDTTKAAMSYVEFYSFKKLDIAGRNRVEQLMLQGAAALDPASEVAIVVGSPDLHRQLSR